MDVQDVRVGAEDAAGRPINLVYVKKAPHYAIYRTPERVMVHLADAAAERSQQQEILSTLNPIRTEIHGLIDGWRTSNAQDKEALTRLFDGRIADSLAIAMEGDSVTAQALLSSTLGEIAEERQSRGRIEQLYYSLGTAVAIAVVMIIASRLWNPNSTPYFHDDLNALFFAAGIGGFGALVSIGIAVRERALTTDLQTRDNIADAILRVCVGAVGAVLLVAMMRSDLIDVAVAGVELADRPSQEQQREKEQGAGDNAVAPARGGGTGTENVAAPSPEEGDAPADANAVAPATDNAAAPATANATAPATANSAAGAPEPPRSARPARSGEGQQGTGGGERIVDRHTTDLLLLLVISFFAGFTERLVKQLAARVRFRDVAAAVTSGGAAAAAGLAPAVAGRNRQTGSTAPAAAPEELDLGPEADVDGCVSDIPMTADEETDDSQLPPAEGGVEEARP